jgi:hypothetical protein
MPCVVRRWPVAVGPRFWRLSGMAANDLKDFAAVGKNPLISTVHLLSSWLRTGHGSEFSAGKHVDA